MYVVSFQQRSKVECQKFVIGINYKTTQNVALTDVMLLRETM